MAFGRKTSPTQTIVPVAGDRASVRLLNGLANHFLTLVIRATVQVTVAAATAIRNRGSVCAIFDEIGVSENGSDVLLLDGMSARTITELFSPSQLTAVRAQVGVATYNLVEMIRIPMAGLYNAVPGETAFLERDPRQALEVFVKQSATPSAALFNAGPATIAVTAVSVTVAQEGETNIAADALPWFRPRIRQIVDQVPGTNAAQVTYIKTSNPLRMILVKQECSTSGEAADILNAFALRGDNADVIGPRQYALQDFQLAEEAEFGGDAYNVPIDGAGAYLGIHFAKYGRLSDALNPSRYNNLRLESSVQVSPTGTGTSRLRITLIELERDLTAGIDGRTIVNPSPLPFTL